MDPEESRVSAFLDVTAADFPATSTSEPPRNTPSSIRSPRSDIPPLWISSSSTNFCFFAALISVAKFGPERKARDFLPKGVFSAIFTFCGQGDVGLSTSFTPFLASARPARFGCMNASGRAPWLFPTF
jgi:hypothetical protein